MSSATIAPLAFYYTNANSTASIFRSANVTLLLSKSTTCEPDRLIIRRPIFAFLYVYVFSAVIALGLPCNALAFFVLWRDRVASTTRVFLLALTASNNAVLFLMFLWYSLGNLFEITNWSLLQPIGHAEPYLYAFANISKFIQIWLTVAVSADRFYCVRFPLSAARLCTPKRASLAAVALLPVSLALNVPRFLVYKTQLHVNQCTGRKHFHYGMLTILPAWFLSLYRDVFDALVYYVIPLLLLLFLNISLIWSLRAASQKRNKMVLHNVSSGTGHKNNNRVLGRDNMITLTLIVVVSAFIVLETPSAVLNILDFFFKGFSSIETVKIYAVIFILLSLINSSMDLFLYALVNSNFRNALFELLPFKCLHRVNITGQQQTRNHNTVTKETLAS